MNSLLVAALFAQAVMANPIYRRQPVYGSHPTRTTSSGLTTLLAHTPTRTGPPNSSLFTTVSPLPTGGPGSDNYWLCSFPPSSVEPTGVASSLPFPSTLIVDTSTATVTEVVTETLAATATEIIADTSDAAVTEDPATSLLGGLPDLPTFGTDSILEPSVTPDLLAVSVTTTPPSLTTPPPSLTSTYTVVGPQTTAVIECVRAPPPQDNPPQPLPTQLTQTRSFPISTLRPTATLDI